MKIGVSTACFYPLETEKALKLVCDSEAETTEVFFNASCELEPSFVRELSGICKGSGTQIVSVHPTMSLAESFMLFSGYERRYKEGLENYKRYANIAAELGARYIIMHGGKVNDVLDTDGYCERFYSVAQAVKENGAILLQENVVNYRAGKLEVLERMCELLGDDVGFCLDVKQSVRSGYSPFDALRRLGTKIKHIHLSDHTDKNDCLLPSNGDFDFQIFFRTVAESGYSGDAVIEVYKNAYNSYGEIFTSLKKLKNDYLFAGK